MGFIFRIETEILINLIYNALQAHLVLSIHLTLKLLKHYELLKSVLSKILSADLAMKPE